MKWDKLDGYLYGNIKYQFDLYSRCCLVAVISDSFVIPATIACQAPLSMGFSRPEYWSGFPFPSPGDLPDSGIESTSEWAGCCFTTEPPGKPSKEHVCAHTGVHRTLLKPKNDPYFYQLIFTQSTSFKLYKCWVKLKKSLTKGDRSNLRPLLPWIFYWER